MLGERGRSPSCQRWRRRLHAQPPRKKSSLSADEERSVAAVRARAKTVGLEGFEVRSTEHFVGVGNAPPEHYNSRALGICESFAKDFLAHFRERDFKLEFPARRMVVVALKDANSYEAYSGDKRAVAVGGHYDVDANELVVFDFRPNQAGLAADPKRVNTFTLVHETAHMLSYNSGLLPAGRDIPVAISEGLATYAELWTPPRDRKGVGKVNEPPPVGVRPVGLLDSDRPPVER